MRRDETSRSTAPLSGLRVSFIAGTLGQGGAELQLFYIVKALLERGGLPRVLSLSAGEFWEEPISDLGIPVVHVGRSPSKIARMRAILSELRRHPADVIQSQHFYTNLYSAAAARILGSREIGAIRNTVDYELRSTGRLLGGMSLRVPRRIAANSVSAIREAIERGIPERRLFHLPNVVDTDRFAPPIHVPERTGIRLLAAGRLVPQKRFDRFLDILAGIRASHPDVTGTVVGSGPLRQALQERAAALGLLPDAVRFEGSLSDMRSAYWNADIFVLTSDHEGTPNVLLEAMASGLPVVATNVGGVSEHVTSGENGIAIEPGNDEALAGALSKLIAEPRERERLGRNAREYMVRNVSVAELPRYLSELYPAPGASGPRASRARPAGGLRGLEPSAGSGEALRILAVTNIYPTEKWPTAGIFLREQLEGLRRSGVQVEVLLIDRLTQGVRSYVNVGDQVTARVKEFDPHLVHVLYGGVIADRVARAVRDRPVVVTYHGSDLQGSVLARARVRLMAEYGVWCSRRAARLASGVVIVSEHLRGFLPEGSARRDAKVIPCGIDLERFTPEDRRAARDRLGWSQEGFHLLFATSNDDPIKRPGLARSAVERLRRSGEAVELHVMHDVPYDLVPTWLNASDALLLTSLREGSPTIVKEALACNRPVVSVAVGDVPDQIEGIDGCHLAEATPESLAEKLALVARGKRQIDGRGRAGRYDTRRIAARLRDFYQEILGDRHSVSMAPLPASSRGGP